MSKNLLGPQLLYLQFVVPDICMLLNINNRLTWQDHVDQMFSKINKKLGLLKRIRYCLPLDARLLFFNSYVLPLFDYADIVWGDRGNSTLMLQLQSLHNKAAKII